MPYHLVGIGQTLPALTAQEQSEVDRIIDILPDCWTQEVSDCIDGVPNSYKHCAELTERYVSIPSDTAVHAHVKHHINKNIPYCHQNALIKSPLGYGLIAGAAILGIAIGIAIPTKG